MNNLKKLLGGIVLLLVSVVGFVLFATVGLAILLVVLGLLFVGALALRGKKSEQQMGQVRVITFGMPASGEKRPDGEYADIRLAQTEFAEARHQQGAAEQGKEGGDCVDLSEDDYHLTGEKGSDQKKS